MQTLPNRDPLSYSESQIGPISASCVTGTGLAQEQALLAATACEGVQQPARQTPRRVRDYSNRLDRH
jgi:hypothetical protein